MTQTLSRRTALRILAAGSAAGVLAACAPVAPTTSTPAQQNAGPTTAPNPAPTATQNNAAASS
jgi:hypothetical protein